MYITFLDNDEDSVATSGDADKVDRVVKSIRCRTSGESASSSQGVYICMHVCIVHLM